MLEVKQYNILLQKFEDDNRYKHTRKVQVLATSDEEALSDVAMLYKEYPYQYYDILKKEYYIDDNLKSKYANRLRLTYKLNMIHQASKPKENEYMPNVFNDKSFFFSKQNQYTWQILDNTNYLFAKLYFDSTEFLSVDKERYPSLVYRNLPLYTNYYKIFKHYNGNCYPLVDIIKGTQAHPYLIDIVWGSYTENVYDTLLFVYQYKQNHTNFTNVQEEIEYWAEKLGKNINNKIVTAQNTYSSKYIQRSKSC